MYGKENCKAIVYKLTSKTKHIDKVVRKFIQRIETVHTATKNSELRFV